jgi:hypothetical protein
MYENNDEVARIDVMIALAERELHAFTIAVARCFGDEQAHLAAEDWFHHLEVGARGLAETARDFRQITLATAAQLALRVGERVTGFPRSSAPC